MDVLFAEIFLIELATWGHVNSLQDERHPYTEATDQEKEKGLKMESLSSIISLRFSKRSSYQREDSQG